MTTEEDDNTHSIEIGVDAEEQDLGVVGGRCIRWKRSTMYVYELCDGGMVVGLHLAPPFGRFDQDIGRARARRKAIEQVHYRRARQANEQERLRQMAAMAAIPSVRRA